MSSSSKDATFVQPGGCYLQNELIRCALDTFHCMGLEFRSAQQMKSLEDPAAERCNRPHPDFVGMCTSEVDNFHCTGHSSGCVIQTMFVPNIPYCSLQYNHFPGRDTHLTLYGSCESTDRSTCVWSIDDCNDSTDTYTAASFPLGDNDTTEHICTCDRVQTGACLQMNNDESFDMMCAVSADACDDDSYFQDWKEVLKSGMDCRLCPGFDKDASNVSTERMHPHWQNDRSNNNHSHEHIHATSNSSSINNTSSCRAGIVAGTVVGGILVALLATLVVNYVLCRSTTRATSIQNKANASTTGVPEQTVQDDMEEKKTSTTGTLA